MSSTPSSLKLVKWIVIVGAVMVGLWFLGRSLLTLDDIKQINAATRQYAETHPVAVFLILGSAQLIGMVFSLPTKALLTLLAGALLGPLWGSINTALGVLLGTSILFLAARHLFRQRVMDRLMQTSQNPSGSDHSDTLVQRISQRLSDRPIRAIAGLRMVITLPYGGITLAAAMTSIRFRDFFIGSLLGDLAVIVSYTFAGERLAAIESISDALSPTTVGMLLGVGLVIVLLTFFGNRNRVGKRAH